MNKKIKKILSLNLGIILTNILVFSKIGLGFRIGASVMQTILSILIIAISLIIFIKGNKNILDGKTIEKEAEKNKVINLNTIDDFRTELIKCSAKKEFQDSSQRALKQLDRLIKKTELLEDILAQHFDKNSLTYDKFHVVIDNTQELFFDNLKKMILKIMIFDQDDYSTMARDSKYLSKEATLQKNAIYKEYINYANVVLEKNEHILVKLDNLLLELSKLDDVEESNIEDFATIQDVNELIEQTKFYKGVTKNETK